MTARPTKIECVDCAKRPSLPDDVVVIDRCGFRPKVPRKIDPRSLESHKTQPRCRQDWLGWDRARKARTRTGHKAKTYGVSREVQAALWTYQGSSCPCGRKAAMEIPAGVTLDHEHGAPCIVRGDHDEKSGCLECVTGFVCAHCNKEIIGKLEGCFRKRENPREAVMDALQRLARHIQDPPLRRLLAGRPDLVA